MNKILIVEDDKFISNAYRIKLEKSGFEIISATDGQEAIDILKKETPDLILLDLVMPIKDGFSTLKEIKANPAWSSIPIIVASNLGLTEDIDRAMAMGATGYIIKTELSMSELIGKIMATLKESPFSNP